MGRVAAGEDESGEMGKGFHRSAESLLANEGESVGVVNNDPAECVLARVGAFTEVVNLIADGVDTAVFLTGEPKDGFNLEGGFFAQERNEIF